MSCGDEIGATTASYHRSNGTRSENSARCIAPVARVRRIASRISGTRRPSETGSPRRSAGASALARALSATTSPVGRSATTGSGNPANTASNSGSPARATGRASGASDRTRVRSAFAATRAATARTAAKAASAGSTAKHAGEPEGGKQDSGAGQHQARLLEAFEPHAQCGLAAVVTVHRHFGPSSNCERAAAFQPTPRAFRARLGAVTPPRSAPATEAEAATAGVLRAAPGPARGCRGSATKARTERCNKAAGTRAGRQGDPPCRIARAQPAWRRRTRRAPQGRGWQSRATWPKRK